MGFLKKGFNFYISSSIHVALAVTSLAAVTRLELVGHLRTPVLAFIFLGTISGYNFVKYAGIAKLHHYSLTKNLRVIQIFSLLAFVALLYFFSVQSRDFWVLTCILGLSTLLYSIPFLPKHTNLRNLKGTKIFIIAFVWAGVCVLLPLVDIMPLFTLPVILKWCQIFLFVISITIPFEVRDLKYDPDGLGTLPQLIGIKKVKILGYVFLVLVMLLQVWIANFQFWGMISTILIGIISIWAIVKTRKDQPKYYTSFWVEAIPILWFLLELGALYGRN